MYLNSLVLIGVLFFVHNIWGGKLEFTNVVCDSFDKSFADFPYCYLKSVNRSYKYLSIRAKLYQIPITNCSFSFAFKKRANGYKPFLYSATVDACKFLKHVKSANPVIKFFYSFLKTYSNINHSCPYDHDLILDKVDTSFSKTGFNQILPWPEGDYAVFTTWTAYNKPRANVNIFVKVTD